ncbi:protein FAR1-RELATED SEQUENCE 5-like [Papaver somniferum]|uniref:protein FAR1-RELATED SEQUENCE 5-like n=1 Tax=Papaver somniferum TaxID=3469 RepID=UPI000E704B0F|nr:protein FAR1-RELATED SEQUENCE 5-like [Papaver somniferum]
MSPRRNLTKEFDLSLLNPEQNLTNEFDLSLLNGFDFSEWHAHNSLEESRAHKDFQMTNEIVYEEEEDIYKEDTNKCTGNNEDIMSVDRENNDGIFDEIAAPKNTKQLPEEELNSIHPFIGKEFESQDEAYDSITGMQKNGRWVVTSFTEEHNHKLVSPSKRHHIRSLRVIKSSQKQVIVNMRLAGVKTNQMMNYLVVESGGVRNIGFLPKDARNYISTRQQLELKHGDAQAVLDYFQRQQVENPSFFYSIQVDAEGQMTNFFWEDAKSRMNYYYFGDVVCFDPTYSTNRYDMPFVPIVGVNHHYQTVLFGGALLYSESEESFEWVMKTWMRAMHDKAPKVILTDQESSIGGAIAYVLPGTRHRFCLWHICRNAMKNSSNVTKEFVSEFNKCLYGYERIKEFELLWATMLKNHNLEKKQMVINIIR